MDGVFVHASVFLFGDMPQADTDGFFLRWALFSDSITEHYHEWLSTSSMWLWRGGPAGGPRHGRARRLSRSPAIQTVFPDGGFSGKPSVVVRSARTQGDKLLAGVPEKSGAYKLVVSSQGKVGIGAHDERGAFYAM